MAVSVQFEKHYLLRATAAPPREICQLCRVGARYVGGGSLEN